MFSSPRGAPFVSMRMGCNMRILRTWPRAARDHCSDALPSTKTDNARGPKGPRKRLQHAPAPKAPAKAPRDHGAKSSRKAPKAPTTMHIKSAQHAILGHSSHNNRFFK
eukprot:8175205-Pyramimonas_sp.AAC.1